MGTLAMVMEAGKARPLYVRVRHEVSPGPSGCRWCGRDARGHGLSYSGGAGYHSWEAPTTAQRKSRIIAHATARRAAVVS